MTEPIQLPFGVRGGVRSQHEDQALPGPVTPEHPAAPRVTLPRTPSLARVIARGVRRRTGEGIAR